MKARWAEVFRLWILAATCLCAVLPRNLAALPLSLPEGALLLAERVDELSSQIVPMGPWADGGIPGLRAEGALHQSAWRVDGSASTLALLAPLREELEAAGYEIAFECETTRCGGFDFRFAIDVFPEPEMHVDLGDFRFLSARNDAGFVTLLLSRSTNAGFLQITHVRETSKEDAVEAAVSSKSPDPALDDLVRRLQQDGALPLDDLRFDTGAATLAVREYASLAILASFLRDNPEAQVTLVGHSDADGSLQANVALSKRRAAAVLDRLVTGHGVLRSQLHAEGVGFLAPRAGNDTDEGRLRNRRVEAVLSRSPR